jgi:signal transduction histidine kinase
MHNNFENFNTLPAEAEINVEKLLADLERAQKHIEELKIANQRANENLSVATHQIRSPLASIKGYASLILEGDFGEVPEYLREPLNTIFKAANSAGKTVNDFLDLSRMEQGAMRYYLKDFDLSNLVQEAVNEIKGGINENNLELKLNIGEGPFLIHSDKAKLKHVLINLIDNANKYTKEGYIEVSLQRTVDNKVIFSVKDTGVGIKPETLLNLFQKFSRDTDANKQNIHGTGLGLYVAKKLIEARHGRIWAESEGDGKGSQFYVELDLIK